MVGTVHLGRGFLKHIKVHWQVIGTADLGGGSKQLVGTEREDSEPCSERVKRPVRCASTKSAGLDPSRGGMVKCWAGRRIRSQRRNFLEGIWKAE